MTPKTNERLHENNLEDRREVSPTRELFKTAHGYATRQARTDYMMALNFSDDDDDIPTSLNASFDPDDPLYPWQVYSLLGAEPIHDLMTKFYNRVYDDEDDTKFRRVFTRLAPIQHHIMAQTRFWIDAMGGGRTYHGGDGRLNWHHQCNAHSVMNAAGAKRWMYHMRSALMDVREEWDAIDKRIVPCVLVFLKVKMQKYADRHGWAFNDTDFDLVKERKGEKESKEMTGLNVDMM